MTIPCRMCGFGQLDTEVDLGTAAFCVTSPLSAADARNLGKHPFRLATCRDCGVIELMDIPPLEALRPAERAILYRDPERHLDDLAQVTASLMTSRNALVVGMTYKDAPLLTHLESHGFTNQRLLDRDDDWQLHDPRAGIETIQSRCTVTWADGIRQKYGPVGLLLVRHVLEHAHHPDEFLAACRRLTEPDGLVLIEVPGCETELARGDAGALWEEHLHYFTMESLRRGLSCHGLRPLIVGNYPYTVEDCLVAVGGFGEPSAPTTMAEASLLQEFHRQQAIIKQRMKTLADQLHSQGQRIAVYGAGHRTATWLELAGLSEIVDCVIDDDPTKQGRYLAGSGVVVGSTALLRERNIGACVGLLSVDILQRIAVREAAYVSAGGRFLTLDDVVAGAP